MDIAAYWKSALSQQPGKMRSFFRPDAPGEWQGNIERTETISDLIITVVHVYSADQTVSCHATSFFTIKEDKIARIDEYWGDDGPAPQWRLDKRISRPIR